MAEQGEVLRLKRRVEFAPDAVLERMLILQCDALNRALATTVAAPLVKPSSLYEGDPTCLRLSPSEAGADGPRVVLLTQLRAVPWECFEPVPVGCLAPPNFAAMLAALHASYDL